MKRLFAFSAIAIGLALAGQAHAHGAKPKHGGTVQTVSDVAFELVSKDGKAVIYVEDHGKGVSTDGASGKLTVLDGTVKTEVELKASGGNTLTSTAEVKLAAGTKAVASVTLAGKEAVNVRFAHQ